MSLFGSLSTVFGRKSTVAPVPEVKPPVAPKQPADVKPKVAKPISAPTPVVDQKQVEEAQARAREILFEARAEALRIREEAERQARDLQEKLLQRQASLDDKLANLDKRLSQVDSRENQLEERQGALDKTRAELVAKRDELIAELERVSSLTKDEARAELLSSLEHDLDRQAAKLIEEKLNKAREEADHEAMEILVDAMKHGATDYVTEYTISTVKLPDPDMKGRIIGKEGRNIRAFERATGVDIDLDELDNQVVRLSCFDPVRREIARVSLERLLKDGRIQPSRIDEVVEKVTKEIERIMFEEGKRLAHRFQLYNLPSEIIALLGRFKYRFSYGQNLIQHTIEETQIGLSIARELGLNLRTVAMGCLFHDIGKVVEGEGNHIELGVQILKKHNFAPEVIACVAESHEDIPFSSLESMVVHIADAISGARPGARSENHEEYVKRLQKLEEIALSYEGVARAFAIQAGREVRVLLQPDQSTDRDCTVIAQKIATQIENELTYPGTVTVNVAREMKASATAK